MKILLKHLGKYALAFLLSFISLGMFAQIEEELGFIYVKAEYMMETARYQEAADELSALIQSDSSYEEALLKRAECYYNTDQNNRALDDLLESFKIKGITTKGLKLFGLINASLGKFEAADNTLDLALLINYKDAEVHFAKAENYRNNNDMKSACAHWEIASNLGHDKSRLQMGKYCRSYSGNTRPTKKDSKFKEPVLGTKIRVPQRNDPSHTKNGNDPMVLDEGVDLNTDTLIYEQEYEYVEPEPEIDDSVAEVFVDEDLSLSFKNGIGSRKILEQPDILILSETAGNVAVDICINKRGKVESAELNKEETTIRTPSLVSLAKRKAMEFWFEKNSEKEMCGTIIFMVNGGS